MYETINLYIKSYRDYAQHNIRPLKPDEHLEPIAPPTEVFAMAVPRNTAQITTEFIVETSLTFGVPSYILTDQGIHFGNELIAGVLSVFSCAHTFATAHHS
ncbi:unnamed protein product [Adineta steineri]|uniref:Integrase catalytic domain-containing protein n=1 Tax=Adineta steineri TaxID=433720 RepID=A0A816FDG3_9BILA|nr:unnamed protein product [Adineta steineri]CAF1660125.1 unnamed protein product [Adineta steineri]